MPEENSGQLGKAVKEALQEVHVQGLVERITKLLTDVDVMVDYASETGQAMSQDLVDRLAQLDCERSVLCQTPPTDQDCRSEYTNLVKVHNLLVAMVSPATPTTLRSTERMWGFLTKNWAVNLIFGFTIVSLILLVMFYAFKGPNVSNSWGWTIVFASMLGAGLYSLSQARNYILERTYNPQYDMAYYIRYFTGVTSGIILAFFGPKLMGLAGVQTTAAKEAGTIVLALVGGFAADAVLQLLQRVGDTLRTMVRGTDKDVTEKQGKAAKAEAAATASKLKSDFITQLNKLSTGEPEGTQKKIKELIKKLAP